MSEIKLLPCPFCGGEAELSLFLGNYHVTCTKCLGAIFPARGMLKGEAIEAWNTRKPMERIVERLEELHKYNSEQADIYRDSEIQNYLTRERTDMYMDRANCYGVAIRTIKAGGKDE